ncbi:uncharacterized protein I206_102969 [Kwoniella pini CBS 10737]|uniref:Uncharacterized protein n=1 Tax=Kwoniella pini CBS 10737 TaxID=1296096 RepID=A0A1B9I6Y4_9TREE|nr:uncharacterized protein I206_03321 [Kwoniella pini CBS 10737]OCF51254.1 hypothetical protein I206_03321 [Kwoniella pini CBS 10737]
MSPQLSEDIFLLIGQQLQSANHHCSLSNLSLTSKDNYRLLTPLTYRHVIMTDHSLPALLFRIINISSDEKRFLFEKIKDQEKDDLLSTNLQPIKRLKIQLQYIHKLTIDTNFEKMDFESLSALAKALGMYLGELLFPSVSRLIITSRHGTNRRIGLLADDREDYVLRTFLPLACRPTYVCCTFDKDTPTCGYDTLVPQFSLTDSSREIVNIHQARRIVMPFGHTTSRVSFGEVTCTKGDTCPDKNTPHHPKRCIERIKTTRMNILLEDITALPLDFSDASMSDNGNTNNPSEPPLTIIEYNRCAHSDQLSYQELMVRLDKQLSELLPSQMQLADQMYQMFTHYALSQGPIPLPQPVNGPSAPQVPVNAAGNVAPGGGTSRNDGSRRSNNQTTANNIDQSTSPPMPGNRPPGQSSSEHASSTSTYDTNSHNVNDNLNISNTLATGQYAIPGLFGHGLPALISATNPLFGGVQTGNRGSNHHTNDAGSAPSSNVSQASSIGSAQHVTNAVLNAAATNDRPSQAFPTPSTDPISAVIGQGGFIGLINGIDSSQQSNGVFANGSTDAMNSHNGTDTTTSMHHQAPFNEGRHEHNHWSDKIKFVFGQEAELEPLCEACGGECKKIMACTLALTNDWLTETSLRQLTEPI